MEEDLQSPTARVQFSDDLSAPVPAESKRRVELTQRYDREAVQRRLDIESWMDEQLKILFNCNDDDYPMLDLDDVLQFEADKREERLREYLKDAKVSPENFIQELLKKAATVSKIH
jgi:hypothetical protein